MLGYRPMERRFYRKLKKMNIRPAPSSYWVDNNDTVTQPEQSSLSNYTEWSVGVTIGNEGAISMWNLESLGFQANITRNVGVATTATAQINVPPGYRTRLMIYDAVIHYHGKADTFDPGGYSGTVPFDFDVPDNPAGGIMMDTPSWGGGTGGTGGGG